MAAQAKLFLVFVGLVKCIYGSTSEDVIQLKINLYNQYIYERHFEEEEKTCDLAVNVTNNLMATFVRDLDALLAQTSQTFSVVTSMVNVRGGRGCIKEVEDSYKTISEKESKKFNSCLRVPIAKQTEQEGELNSVHNEYQAGIKKTLSTIDQCAALFPNERDKKKKEHCVKVNSDRYFDKVVKIGEEYFKENCMKHFEESVIKCVAKSLDNVVAEVLQLFKVVVRCTEMFDVRLNPEVVTSITSPESHIILQPTIKSQIEKARNLYKHMTADPYFEYFITFMIEAQKTVLADRTQGYYARNFTQTMAPYFTAVNRSLHENKHPKESTCGKIAHQLLEEHVGQGAKDYENCYVRGVEVTTSAINDIGLSFSYFADKVTELGNVAILQCLNEGYIFATNAVYTCYSMKFNNFFVFEAPKNFEFAEKMWNIQNKDFAFYNGSGVLLPCAIKVLHEAEQKAENVLLDYQKCMYRSTGTDYSMIGHKRSIFTDVHFTTRSRLFSNSHEAVHGAANNTEMNANV